MSYENILRVYGLREMPLITDEHKDAFPYSFSIYISALIFAHE